MKQFRSLSASKHYNGDSPQLKYTAHLIKTFLDMDPDMIRFWDCFHFKSASANMGVEIVVDGGKVLLHDLTLSSVYIHRKPQFVMCFRHLRVADSLEKAESDKDDNNIHLDDYSVISTSASTSRRDTPSQFHLTSTRISSPGLEYVDRSGGFDSDSDDDDPSTGPVHRANYGYDKMPVNVHEDLITDCLQDKVAARAAPLVNTGLPPLLRTSLTIAFRI